MVSDNIISIVCEAKISDLMRKPSGEKSQRMCLASKSARALALTASGDTILSLK